ncbi:MAG: SirB1 family protein [Pseudomonadota bacterium]
MGAASEPVGLLRAAGRAEDAAIDLAGTALALASLDHPGADLRPYREHLAALAQALGAEAGQRGAGLAARLAALGAVLVEGFGYQGAREDYDDLANADLMRVIDRRRGLPVALSILWLHAGRAQGWTMTGLNFPGHFLIRLEGAGEGAILDPFNAGRRMAHSDLRDLLKAMTGAPELAPEHCAPVGNRALLLRLQNNIKLRLLRQANFAGAATALERMTLIAPAEPSLWHECGLVHARLGNLRAALGALEEALRLAGSEASRHRIEQELAELKGRLN